MFAPNNAKLISVALSGIPVSCVVMSSFSTLPADELLRRVVCVSEAVRVPVCGLTWVDPVVTGAAILLLGVLTSSDWLLKVSSVDCVLKEAVALFAFSVKSFMI